MDKNSHQIIDLVDSIGLNNSIRAIESSKEIDLMDQRNSPKATCIILIWIAERLLYLVLKIGTQGQEIESDGYDDVLCGKQPEEDLKRDLILNRMLLENIVGEPIYGYLAASFP